MVLIDIVIVLVGVITLGYFYVKRLFNYWGGRGVLQVQPTFPTGNMPSVNSDVPAAHRYLELYNHFKSQKQLFGGMYMFVKPIALIVDVDLIKSVLVKDFNYFMNRGVPHNEVDDPLTGHLFSIEGTKWKNLRSKLTPTFTSGKMKMMFPTIVSVANEFEKCLNLEIEKNPEIEMKDLLARFTTDVIGTCAFGLDCNSLKDPEAEFRQMGRNIFQGSKARMLKAMFFMTFPNFAKKMHLTQIPTEISSFFLKAVKDTVDYREKNNVQRNDFMNLLIQLKNNGKLDDDTAATNTRLTFNEIAAQAFVFFGAGFETSSTVMTFALYELCQNLEIQEKGREEVIQVLKEHNNQFTYEAVLEMKYLDQILNESLRKYPPAALLLRQVEKDYKVPDSNHILEKGTQIGIPAYALHHDPEYYPNSDVFDPERFTDQMVRNRNAYTFLPFGEGPRNCIGLRFGLLQAKIGLAMLLRNFKFSNCSKSTVPLILAAKGQVLSPVGGLYLKIDKV